jgi:hypothetical protein
MTTTLTKPNTIPALQFSSRYKLNDIQREQLRAAFNRKLNEDSPESAGRGGIRVATAHVTNIEAAIGCDKLTFASLIASRESIAIPVLLRLQRELQVEIITEKGLRESFDSYVDHLKREYW